MHRALGVDEYEHGAHAGTVTTVRSTLAPHSLELLQAQFSGGRDYLAACTLGLPTIGTRAAVIADLDAAASGHPNAPEYTAIAERTRAHFARLVGVNVDRVAIGSQTSVFAGLIAQNLPDGAEVLCAAGDFSSLLLPFEHAGRGVHLRCVPLESLATEITDATALVAFSLVQSATGEVADADAIVEAAARHGVRTLCDATQAVGWMPVDAAMFDALICHAYKWLCAPRGVAFCAVSASLAASMRPVFAGWYSGEDPWASCYGHDAELSTCARRFDVSPAWQAFVGAEPALAAFADADPGAVHSHVVELATTFRERMALPLPERPSAIVTWADPTGENLARLSAAGITASGRAGRARVAFHVFNDLDDVERTVTALRL